MGPDAVRLRRATARRLARAAPSPDQRHAQPLHHVAEAGAGFVRHLSDDVGDGAQRSASLTGGRSPGSLPPPQRRDRGSTRPGVDRRRSIRLSAVRPQVMSTVGSRSQWRTAGRPRRTRRHRRRRGRRSRRRSARRRPPPAAAPRRSHVADELAVGVGVGDEVLGRRIVRQQRRAVGRRQHGDRVVEHRRAAVDVLIGRARACRR